MTGKEVVVFNTPQGQFVSPPMSERRGSMWVNALRRGGIWDARLRPSAHYRLATA